MQPWEDLDSATVPGTDTPISLHRRGDVFSIRVGGVELMNNWIYGIDCDLADHGCAAVDDVAAPRVLVGGLGMGFTLGRALQRLGPTAEVVVAELVPAVVRWNEGVLAELAGRPLDDPRVRVEAADVRELLRNAQPRWDAVLLDVDNGPESLSSDGNGALYSGRGLARIKASLNPGGVLAVWSLTGDRGFEQRLERAGYDVRVHDRRGRAGRARQTIFVARRRG